MQRFVFLAFLAASSVEAFGGISSYHRRYATTFHRTPTRLAADATTDDDSAEATKIKVGNLVADDEWEGFSMELTELVRVAVIEDVKKNTQDFTGKDDYKVGDIAKELDVRVKSEVARFRGKDDYELGDLTIALDDLSKKMTCELTGKEDYEAGDLSTAIDSLVKDKVSDFCGKDSYEVGDLSKEMDKRVKGRVAEFTGKGEYNFGDITNEVEDRRRKWVGEFLGKEAGDNYQFGDLTMKTLNNLSGKDGDYEFGDVTKNIIGNLFGPRKSKGKKD